MHLKMKEPAPNQDVVLITAVAAQLKWREKIQKCTALGAVTKGVGTKKQPEGGSRVEEEEQAH